MDTKIFTLIDDTFKGAAGILALFPPLVSYGMETHLPRKTAAGGLIGTGWYGKVTFCFIVVFHRL